MQAVISPPSEWIISPTAETFEQDVLERSARVPVVVDFWASWCGPCRQLAPVLEKLAEEFAGRFILAKIDTERSPTLAASFGVHAIPFVIAIRDRQIVDQFAGVLPEATLREWIAGILPSPAEELVRSGAAVEPSDPGRAEQSYREALRLDPGSAAAKIALARVLHEQGHREEARSLVAELEERGYLEPEAQRLKSALEVETVAAKTGGIDAARRAAGADPENPERQLELADALAAEGRHAEAMDVCLRVIEQHPAGARDKARETMLNVLNLLDADGELAGEYRRKLASALY